jgi:riboflavin kinase/FMN adenylyltransferase
VAVGVFDGLHRGHQSVIKKVVSIAKKKKTQSVILTFFPHPDLVVKPSQRSPLLISLKHRLSLIESFGVDVCTVIKFSKHFSKIKAEAFTSKILIKKCQMKYLVVSRSFIFGKNRRGSYALLKKLSHIYGFKVYFKSDIKLGRKNISSTAIRALISMGKLNQAQKLLGRRVEVVGTVIGGDSRGRILGFPTANIDPHHEVIPPQGVYIIEAWLNKKKLLGLANIGFRPTFKKQKNEVVEVHFLKFRKNIYGKELRVVFIKKIRSEKKFRDKSHLISQIHRDIHRAKAAFSL